MLTPYHPDQGVVVISMDVGRMAEDVISMDVGLEVGRVISMDAGRYGFLSK